MMNLAKGRRLVVSLRQHCNVTNRHDVIPGGPPLTVSEENIQFTSDPQSIVLAANLGKRLLPSHPFKR